MVLPTSIRVLDAERVISVISLSATVTVQVAVSPFSRAAVTIAVPAAFALTKPALTVTTSSSLLFQLTLTASPAESCAVSPTVMLRTV